MKEEKKTGNGKRRIIISVVCGIAALLLLTGILYAAGIFSKLDKTDLNEDKLVMNEGMDDQKYLNIALFGVDVRSEGDETVESDAVVVASINRETKAVKMFSVYGNALLTTEEGEAIAVKDIYGEGPEQAIEILNRNLDLDIAHYVTVDFMAMIHVVDAVGGVEIDVKKEEIPHITGYTADLIKVTGKDSPGVTEAGPQLLNGTQATAYCRIRATEGGDATRAERQTLVVAKVMEKLTEIELTELDNLIDQVFPMIETNFELTEMLEYGKDFSDYRMETMIGFPFSTVNKNVDGNKEALVPTDFKNDVLSLHQQFFPDLSYEPSEYVEEASEHFNESSDSR